MTQGCQQSTALTFSDVSKTYGRRTVLHDVSLQIPMGRTVALIGHNGAGKTTMMKLLLGLIKPSHGEVRLLGCDPVGPNAFAAKAQLGFLPETVSFPSAMTGLEILNFFARLKGADRTKNMAHLDRVGLAGAAKQRVKTYSKGMRQRLGLAQALLGQPKVLLLDEPTTGLDPALRQTFYDIIDEARQAGVTTLLSSHALAELTPHADSVAIMNNGNMAAAGTVGELRQQAQLPILIRVRTIPSQAAQLADQMRGVDIRHVNGQAVEFNCDPHDKMTLLRRVAEFGTAVEDVEIETPSLEQLYAHFQREDRA